MNRINAIIVDDEQDAREILSGLLKDFSDINILSEESSADSALVAILKFHPDIVFLDIDMPFKSGFDLINELKNYDVCPVIIFVTAFDKFAIQAIKHSAFDYLVKPIDVDDLQMCISRYKAEVNRERFNDKIESLLTNLPLKNIKFNTREGFVYINPNEIFYCIADRNYTDIYLTATGQKQTVTIHLGALIDILPHNFVRINRSTIINKNFLKEVNRKTRKCRIVCDSDEMIFDIPKSYIKLL